MQREADHDRHGQRLQEHADGAEQRRRDHHGQAHARVLAAAVLAGVARRSFLKGTGQSRGCRYPSRAAPLEVFNRRQAELDADTAARKSP